MKMMMMIMPTMMMMAMIMTTIMFDVLKCGNKYLYIALYDRHINLNGVGLFNVA